MSKDVQFIKDVCHLHKLESEYKKATCIADQKFTELLKWRQFLTFTYPQFNRKDFN